MKKVGLIIQGPLESFGKAGHRKFEGSSPVLVRYDTRANIQKTINEFGSLFDTIVVSTWDSELKSGDQWVGATVVSMPDPGGNWNGREGSWKAHNRNRQFIGIQNGLAWLEKNSGIEYVVRIRTDQYVDLKELLSSFEEHLQSTQGILGMMGVAFMRPGIFHVSDLYFASELKTMRMFLDAMLSHDRYEFLVDVHRDMVLKYAYSSFRGALGVSDWAYFPRQPRSGVNKKTKAIFSFMFKHVFVPLSEATLRSVVFRGSPLSDEYLKGMVVGENHSPGLSESGKVIGRFSRFFQYNNISVPAFLSIDWERYFAFRQTAGGNAPSFLERILIISGKLVGSAWILFEATARSIKRTGSRLKPKL